MVKQYNNPAEAKDAAQPASVEESVSQSAAHPPKKRARRSNWRWFIESNFSVALVTVLIGGMFGQYITASIQEGMKDREFQQAWLKTRGDQALMAHKDYLDKEHEIATRAYDLIGNCITSAQDLIDLTDTDFDLSIVSHSSQGDVRTQAIEMLDNYNKVEQQWDVESGKLSLLIDYYHPGQPDVQTTWRETKEAVSKYRGCARQWYKDHRKPVDTTGVCQKEKDELDKHLAALSANLAAVRQYSWEGWESPEKLRSVLNKK